MSVARASTPGSDWSKEEVALVVADYFTMLHSELRGEAYNKTEHRRALKRAIPARNDGSIEFKHQNISAILIQMGYPYISGYKPRGNYQGLLAEGVAQFLDRHARYSDELESATVLQPTNAAPHLRRSYDEILQQPPEPLDCNELPLETWRPSRGRRIDFVRRDAENRRLGRLGEEFVVDLERDRLRRQGRDDLAPHVEWVADTQGDGIGYDILSFDERTGAERFVEVKTTALGKFFPFYVTANEVRCSTACADRYRLFRVFEFTRRPAVFVLEGSLEDACRLSPLTYRAAI
jgi:hypothetical protein